MGSSKGCDQTQCTTALHKGAEGFQGASICLGKVVKRGVIPHPMAGAWRVNDGPEEGTGTAAAACRRVLSETKENSVQS